MKPGIAFERSAFCTTATMAATSGAKTGSASGFRIRLAETQVLRERHEVPVGMQ